MALWSSMAFRVMLGIKQDGLRINPPSQRLWGNKVIKTTQKHLQSQDSIAKALCVLSYATHTISAPMTAASLKSAW